MSRRTLMFLLPGLPACALAGCTLSPQPISEAEFSRLAETNFSRVVVDNEPVSGEMTIYEAMARALKHNLDFRVEDMNAALRAAETGYATAELLPRFTAQAGYRARDNRFQTSSLDIPTGAEVEQDIVSSEKTYNDGDVTFTWNILDFALSYVRARQASDRYLIQLETRRKVTQRIIEDTRTAYWRAVSADRMSRRLKRIEDRARRAVKNARSVASSGAESPLTALSFERELVRIRQTAERLHHELDVARSQLAALVNIAPGTPFKLADADIATPPIAFGLSADEMVAEAIFNRPEIREIGYQGRINEAEATAALLEVLPGLRIHGASALSDDTFLLHDNWVSWGIAASDNLIKLVRLPAKKAAVEAEADLLRTKALATTMVVITQVHISRIRFQHAALEFQTAREYLRAQQELVKHIRAEAQADLVSQQTLLREEMNELVAEVQRDIAHGNVQNAASNLIVSMGYDIAARDLALDIDVKTLAARLQRVLSDPVAVSERAKLQAEREAARQIALRKAAEQKRAREAADRAAKAEADRTKRDQAQRTKLERERLKREADAARRDAVEARKGRPAKRPVLEPPGRTLEWRWPWEARINSKGSDKVYTGTK